MKSLKSIKSMTIVLTGVLLFALNAYALTPTLFVDDDFDASTPGWQIDKFATIQDAVDEAIDGDVIYVYAGEYDENVVINGFNDLTITAEGAGKPNKVVILSPTNIDDGFNVTSNGVKIEGFEIDMGSISSSHHKSAIAFFGNNNTFSNNHILNSYWYGIYGDGTIDYTSITNNFIEIDNGNHGTKGIYLEPSLYAREVSINRNLIVAEYISGPIHVFDLADSSINRNVINCVFGAAIGLQSWHSGCNNNTIMNNEITRSDDSPAQIGINFTTFEDDISYSNVVGHNSIANTYSGISFDSGDIEGGYFSDTMVIHNRIINSTFGINIGREGCNYSKIHHNTIDSTRACIKDMGIDNDEFKNKCD